METRKISTLKINTLVSQEQYDRAYDENKIEQDSIYLVPDNTEEIAQEKANKALQSAKEYTDLAIQNKANTDDLNNHTEDTTIHVTEEDKSKWNAKADAEHNHDDVYYTETEVDAKFTTVNQSIDTLNSEVETVKGDLTSHATSSNTQFETIRSEFTQADTSTLTTAKEYSDANKSAAVAEAKAYTDSEIEKLVTDTEFEGVLTTIQEIQGAMATDTELAQALEEANGKKIDKVEKGSSTKPIYLDSTGTPQEIAYKIEQDLPADAKLTDTTYTLIKDATQKKIQLMSGETLVSEVDDNNTTYEVATTSNIGLLSAEDKTKLDGIETGATKTVIDSELSDSSTNPVQNKVIKSALDNKADAGHTHTASDVSGLVGENVTGQSLETTSGTFKEAAEGAEIFNDHRDRVYGSGGWANSGNIATGEYSHAEGGSATASGKRSHAEGGGTIASGGWSHAEGANAIASGDYSHAEGCLTTASGGGAHAEGRSTNSASKVTTSTDNTEIQTAWDDKEFSLAKGEASHVEGKDNLALGSCSHAEGFMTRAIGGYGSHTEGWLTVSSGSASHAEGYGTTASGQASHAEGQYTKAIYSNSHAEGENTIANGMCAHVEGYLTRADGNASSAHGYRTAASSGYAQAVFGKYNTTLFGSSTADTQDSTNADALFIVGCGTSSAKKNAFRVSSGGGCYGASAFNASGADFAELFEWADGNPDNEDRRGLFVTLDGERIRLANADDDYIGIISDDQAFIGNSASEEWQGKYLTDIFGSKLTQEVEVPEVIDELTGEVIQEATTAIQYVLNPDYDPDEEYVMRENRKEWGIVGLVGQIVLIDDGSCVVGGRVVPKENGIGTASTTKEGYRVMARLDDTHIKVLVK